MTMEGKSKVLQLVPSLLELGPYDAVYSSLMDRACGTMCTVVKKLGVNRVICIDELGQYGNLDSDTVIAYPGHEEDNVVTWQQQGLRAVRLIFVEVTQGVLKNGMSFDEEEMLLVGKVVLVFTHRPILAGLVAAAAGITDAPGIQQILDDKALSGRGFRVFNYRNDKLTLEMERI